MDSVKYESNTHSNPLLGDNELENHEINKIMTNYEIFRLSLNLGIFSFGDRIEQIELFRDKLVKEKKYLKEKEFEYLYSLCKIFPGHTSTQLLFTIAICKSKSLMGGFISLISFISPSLLVMLIVSLIAKNVREYSLSEDKELWDPADDFLLYYMSIFGAGVCQGAVSLLIFNAITVTKSVAKKRFDYSVIFGCGILFYFFDSSFLLILLIMILGGVASCFQGDHDYFLDVSMSSSKLGNIRFLGIPALVTMITIYFVLFMANFIYKGSNTLIYICESFFRIGTFNFGGGHAVIPLMLAEYAKIIEENEILIGYAISSLLPGPLFNIGAFIGSLINSSLIGGIASLISIMLPGILLIMIVLPFHIQLTKNNLVQFFLRGASWATIGFLYVAGIRLWIDSCLINKYTNYLTGSFNIIICLGLLETRLVSSKILMVLSFGALFSLFCKLIEINFL